jgi:hypothetical protein
MTGPSIIPYPSGNSTRATPVKQTQKSSHATPQRRNETQTLKTGVSGLPWILRCVVASSREADFEL